VIGEAVGPEVRLIDPARETVRELAEFLAENPSLDESVSRDRSSFYVSDRTDQFAALASEWLGRSVTVQAASPENRKLEKV
jgi:glutamate racemase